MAHSFSMRAVRTARSLLAIVVATLLVAACSGTQQWHETDITGAMPALDFTMTRAGDGKTVTAADFKGDVVLLYFGYTYCPDVCPTTLLNLSTVLKDLGDKAKRIRVLFVTVDPDRDTLPVLKDYVKAFAPQIVGLRGDADQLAALAKRYRVSYSVTPESGDQPYTVTHSSAIYAFGQSGKVRLLISSMATDKPDTDGVEADLARLVDQGKQQGFFDKFLKMI